MRKPDLCTQNTPVHIIASYIYVGPFMRTSTVESYGKLKSGYTMDNMTFVCIIIIVLNTPKVVRT